MVFEVGLAFLNIIADSESRSRPVVNPATSESNHISFTLLTAIEFALRVGPSAQPGSPTADRDDSPQNATLNFVDPHPERFQNQGEISTSGRTFSPSSFAKVR